MDKLRQAREYFDKLKPRSKGSAGRESAEKSRGKAAAELKERVLDREVSYSTEQPELRYTGKNFGRISDDVKSQVRLQSTGDTFDVVKENPTARERVLKNLVGRASNPQEVYSLTDRERRIIGDAGYEQPTKTYKSPLRMLPEMADSVSRYYRDGKELPPKLTGSKPAYQKKK
jgi:hypothetical protein